MPLPPLPASNTGRAYIDYNDGQFDHTWTVRYVAPMGHADAIDAMATILTVMEPQLYLISIEGARYSVIGSDITFPTTWTGDSSYGAGAMPAVNAPRTFTIGGKSIMGRLTSLTFFGVNMATPDDYVLDAADWGTIWPNVRASLDSYSETNLFVAIDGAQVLWRDRVTVNFNDHFVVEARG